MSPTLRGLSHSGTAVSDLEKFAGISLETEKFRLTRSTIDDAFKLCTLLVHLRHCMVRRA